MWGTFPTVEGSRVSGVSREEGFSHPSRGQFKVCAEQGMVSAQLADGQAVLKLRPEPSEGLAKDAGWRAELARGGTEDESV